MSGNVTKAVICVRNPDSLGEEYDQEEYAKEMQSFQKKIMKASKDRMNQAWNGGSSTMGSLSKAISPKVTQLNTVIDPVLGDVDRLGDRDPILSDMEDPFCFLEVQYNPSSIYFNASGGHVRSTDRSGNMGALSNNELIDRKTPTNITMDCQLIVDDIHIPDAFSGNTFLSASYSGAVRNAIEAFGQGSHSVRQVVEAIIAILTQSQLQDIIFYWGKMSFHGQLTRVTANYTMFNSKGNPIKATIDISIQQLDTSPDFDLDNAYWNDAYEKAFKEM